MKSYKVLKILGASYLDVIMWFLDKRICNSRCDAGDGSAASGLGEPRGELAVQRGRVRQRGVQVHAHTVLQVRAHALLLLQGLCQLPQLPL